MFGALLFGVLLVGCREASDAGVKRKATGVKTKKVVTPQIDPATQLVQDEDFGLVVSQCLGCHSSRLIVQNHKDADQWRASIRWMQKTQNLWPLAPEVEERIVAYLARNYGPRLQGRRASIPSELMPPD